MGAAFGFNSIPYWEYTEGYQIKLNEAEDITWDGIGIPEDTDIPMTPNWNLISYFPSYALDAGSDDFFVLSSILDRVIIAKDGDGNFMMPEMDFSNMPPWREGFGYHVKLNVEGNNNIIFNYPLECHINHSKVIYPSSHFGVRNSTGNNMSLLVCTPDMKSGELAAFNKDNLLIGSGVVNDEGWCGLAIWGDDNTTEKIDGLMDREIPKFKYWNGSEEYEANVIVKTGTLQYEANEMTIGDLDISNTNLPNEYHISDAFPNPFNSMTSIEYYLPSAVNVSMSIFNLSGKELMSIESGLKPAGIHRVSFEGGLLPSGTYYIVLNAENVNLSKSVTLLR